MYRQSYKFADTSFYLEKKVNGAVKEFLLNEKKMPRISAKYPSLRICSLVYNEKSLDIVNENWTYEFMKKNLPIEMIR